MTTFTLSTTEDSEISLDRSTVAGRIALCLRDSVQDTAYASLTPAEARRLAAGLVAAAEAEEAS